ncbi:MAG: metallophosphoesterase [Candidatus Cloacimonetes bacterium]|nr:metallophosphoesterase [Candidatus Cloacimonadota bacterium]
MRKPLLLIIFCFIIGLSFAKIAIFGDTRSNPEIHRSIVAAIVKHSPDIAFHTGDLNSKGLQQSEYDLFHQINKPLTSICPLYPARGNHERSLQLFTDNFPVMKQSSYYTVIHDSIKFIILDSVLDLQPSSLQYKWLQDQIQDSLPAILILHHPVFSSGEHSDELGLKQFLPQLLQNSGVFAVFSGHNHIYERSIYKGISYIVSGGGGAPLREHNNENPYSIVFARENHFIIADRNQNQISFIVYALDGTVLDEFSLNSVR